MKLSGLLVLSIFTLPTSAADTAIVFNGVIDKNCEVKIKNWDRILVAKSHDDMLFSGNVLFTFKGHNYQATDLYVANLALRKNCKISTKSAVIEQ